MNQDRLKLRTLIGLIALVSCAVSATGATLHDTWLPDANFNADSPAGAVIALIDVNVVTMQSREVAEHQTLIIRDRRIAAMGPVASTQVPSGAYELRANGSLFVLPGLADMHVHMFDRDEMLLYLANGVTTVRNMHGLRRHLAWRDSIERGELIGPRIITAGPILDGDPPTRATNVVVKTPEDARRAVNEQLDLGFDFIKIYDNVAPNEYQVIIEEARKRNKQVVGHLPTPVGLERAVSPNGQHGIEHTEELLPLFNDGRNSGGIDTVARRLTQFGVRLTATIGVYESALRQVQDWSSVTARPEMAYVNPDTRKMWGWDETGSLRNGSGPGRERFSRTRNFMVRDLIPAMRRASVKLLVGSDAPIPALVPGFALHDELDLLSESGLSPFEVLQAATVNAAQFAARTNWSGTVRVGELADLVVMSGNPLETVKALRNRHGIVFNGQWYGQPGLQARLDSLAAKYRQVR